MGFFILFVVHPGGFEGQVGWLIALMLGAIVGLPLADRVFKIAPGAERIVLWSSVIGVTLLWYFVISYTLTKTFCFLVRATGCSLTLRLCYAHGARYIALNV